MLVNFSHLTIDPITSVQRDILVVEPCFSPRLTTRGVAASPTEGVGFSRRFTVQLPGVLIHMANQHV